MPRFWLRHCANVSIERPVISATCSAVNNRADARELPGGDSAGPWPPVLAGVGVRFNNPIQGALKFSVRRVLRAQAMDLRRQALGQLRIQVGIGLAQPEDDAYRVIGPVDGGQGRLHPFAISASKAWPC